jgi:hypothetical protein
MSKALDQELYSCFEQLDDSEKESVLQMLKTFLTGRRKSEENVSMEEYNKEIDEALFQESEGKYVTQDEMEKLAAQWKEK